MRIGVVILPDQPWREAVPLWRRAEELGFAHAWTYDHLVWSGLADSPWRSTMPTLAAASVEGARGQDPVSGAEGIERWWRDVARLAAAMDEVEAQDRPEGRAPLERYLSLDTAGPPMVSDVGFAQDQLGRAAELGFTDVVVHWPRPEEPYRGDVGVLEAIAAGRY